MKVPTKNIKQIDHAKAGKRVRNLRLKHKISLRRLAAAMGVSAPFLSDLELGRRNWSEAYFDEAILQIQTGLRA